jgi:ADP-ribose pyrophosphatase YjhB (NUDIX family)
MKVFHKAYGFLIRQAPNGNAEFPVFTAPDGSLHFPGGTVDDGEDLLTGLCRELRELAVHHYYKPEVDKHVKRHDSLVQAAASLSYDFSFTVQSRAKDGMLFEYR